ncbi:hypothetical protein GUITHDRAFT_109594 [Guillardia theta CCMP2712]|uniref:SAM domain-containing protein n=1 Tax=Guillardia theta (strain CCMP2712) TaxID=905079 RepID=L1J7F8_GUITC|nr:hypothetical protein GUITHDRAFT_109594 [Guillardia theta CCMP2712]EKX44473.1 hypothetical protein GUITHDRAFT_109594 [Guillardia theta CCMP2712]|eukprot:XP_005831453.1 hypothetical protein GUITHDRAFT_109594 [Guillardia theta CCMP2712]
MQPDSSIGTGKLFGRPTPAQLLKAGKSIKDGWSHAGEGADDPASTPAQNNNSVEDLDRTNVPKEDDQGFVSAGKESHDYGEVQIGKLYAISEERELASEARHSEDGLEVYPEANSTTDSSQESNATGTIPAHPLDQPGLKSVSFDISQVNEIHCEPQSEAVKTPMKLGAGVDDVLFWLRSIGFSQYEKTFALNRIDFEELFRLKENDLKQMGISIKQNRRLLLEAIEYLRLSLRLQQASNGKDARPNWYLPEIDNAEEQKPVSKTDDKNIPAQKKGYADLSIPSKDDLYLVADSKREAQEWLNQLNAASNVQSSSMIAVSSIKTYHIKLNCLFVQNPANLCKPFLSIGLVDKNGNLVSELNRFDIEPSHDVESKSELSSDNTLSVKLQGEITMQQRNKKTNQPAQGSIKAWTSIRYSHIVPGRTVLDMWLKPVQYVRSSAKSTKSTGFQLTIDVKKPH